MHFLSCCWLLIKKLGHFFTHALWISHRLTWRIPWNPAIVSSTERWFERPPVLWFPRRARKSGEGIKWFTSKALEGNGHGRSWRELRSWSKRYPKIWSYFIGSDLERIKEQVKPGFFPKKTSWGLEMFIRILLSKPHVGLYVIAQLFPNIRRVGCFTENNPGPTWNLAPISVACFLKDTYASSCCHFIFSW